MYMFGQLCSCDGGSHIFHNICFNFIDILLVVQRVLMIVFLISDVSPWMGERKLSKIQEFKLNYFLNLLFTE